MNRSRTVAALRLALLPALVAVALVIAWKAGYFDLDHRRELALLVERGRAMPGIHVLFLATFAVAVALSLPSNVATWVAGAMFGVWLGSAVALAGGLAATVIGYWLARTIARRPAQRLFGAHRLAETLEKRDDTLTLFQLRVIPIAPFAVLTYVAGVGKISLRRLLVATVAGGLPASLAHAFVGTQLMQGLTATSAQSKRALLIAGVVTVVMLVVSMMAGLIRRNGRRH